MALHVYEEVAIYGLEVFREKQVRICMHMSMQSRYVDGYMSVQSEVADTYFLFRKIHVHKGK